MTRTEPPRSRRPYAKRLPLAERREQVLDAAMRVIARNGYRAATMEAVAREAGVTKPVVYGVFPDLGSLLFRLLDRQQGRALAQLFGGLPSSEPGQSTDEYVGRTVRAWVQTVLDDPVTWRPILLAREDTPAVVWERIEDGRERLRGQVADVLRAGGLADDGPVDPDLLAHALIAMGDHFGRLLMTDPDRIDVDRLISTIQALVGAAIAAR